MENELTVRSFALYIYFKMLQQIVNAPGSLNVPLRSKISHHQYLILVSFWPNLEMKMSVMRISISFNLIVEILRLLG